MIKKLHKLEEMFLIGMFIAALLALTAQVLSRYVFPLPLPWTEELARFLFLWIVLFGAAYSMRIGGLISVTVILQLLPRKLQKAITLLMHTLILVFLCVVIWYGFILVLKVSKLPTIAMGVSSAWEYSALPLASILMAIRTLGTLVNITKNGLPDAGSQTLM